MAQAPSFSVTEFAVLHEVTDKTVRSWIRQGCPHEKLGRRGGGQEVRLKVRPVSDWLLERQAERLAGAAGPEIDELKRRRLAAQTRQAELETARALGEVVPVADAAELFGQQVDRVRQRLLAIPHKGAPLVAPDPEVKSCQAALQGLVDEALNELVGYAAERAAEIRVGAAGAAGGKGEAAAAPDGKRVGRPRKKAVERGCGRTRPVGDRAQRADAGADGGGERS